MNQSRQQYGSGRQEERTAIVLSGTWTDAQQATDHFAEVEREGAHLITPSAVIGHIPDGHSIVATTVAIDIENDTYPQKGGKGKRSLLRPALDRIASALAISWVSSRRTDPGTHPYVCEWQVVGVYKHTDGREVEIIGTAGLDLRDGAADAEEIFASAKADSNPESTLRARRQKIREHVESKARLRAIRSLGLRPSYSVEELKAPFVAVHLHHHGRYRDPETQRQVALMMAQASFGGRRALYGDSPTPRALPAPAPLAALPVGEYDRETGEVDELDAFTRGAPQREPIRGQATPQRATPARDQRREERPREDRRESPRQETRSSGLKIPFGRSRGTPIEDATDDDLCFVRDSIADKFEAGDVDPRYEASNRALLNGIKAELGAREVMG